MGDNVAEEYENVSVCRSDVLVLFDNINKALSCNKHIYSFRAAADYFYWTHLIEKEI